MDKKNAAKLVTKLDRNTLRLLGAVGAGAVACAAVGAAMGALLTVRRLQVAAAEKKALPVLQRAAQLYLDQNAPQAEREARPPRGKKAPSFGEAPQEEPAAGTP